MEAASLIFAIFFLGIALTLVNTMVFIKKSYNFFCYKIRRDLKAGKRSWYLASILNGLAFSILPLKKPDSEEFGKLDKSVLLTSEEVLSLLKNDKERISNSKFVEEILQQTEMSIQKYEPATK